MSIMELEPTLQKLLEVPDWNQEAACKRLPEEWFIPPNGCLSNRAKWLLKAGMNACNTTCPIKEACLSNASEDDLRYTVRAGLWPSGLSEAYRGRPQGDHVIPEDRTHCKKGHDLKISGVYKDGRCVECRRETHRKSDAKVNGPKGYLWKNTTPPLTDAELESGVCLQGHDVSSPDDRSGTGRCLSCMAERKKKSNREYGKRRPSRSKKVVLDMSTVQLVDDPNTLVVLDAHDVGAMPTQVLA